jgi:6-phosphogluconate dehydrogenase
MKQKKTLGFVGCGPMGSGLAINAERHGYDVVLYDNNLSVLLKALERLQKELGRKVNSARSIGELLQKLPCPRDIIVSVPDTAVPPVLNELAENGISLDDLVIESGNSHWEQSIERFRWVNGRFLFEPCGVSGGPKGACEGPSIMGSGETPGGRTRARQILKDLAARRRTLCNQEINPGTREEDGMEVCLRMFGPYAAGQWIKNVHNGIEYLLMQIIADTYHMLRVGRGLSNTEVAAVFAAWNKESPLGSFLLGLAAEVAALKDPDGTEVLDHIIDAAGQKGTGAAAASEGLKLGGPGFGLAAAVTARSVSARKAEREVLHALYRQGEKAPAVLPPSFVETLKYAYQGATLMAYLEGREVLVLARERYQKDRQWDYQLPDVFGVWKEGCVIRSEMVEILQVAEQGQEPVLQNQSIMKMLFQAENAWRKVSCEGMKNGIPLPAIVSTLLTFDSLVCARLPANIIQALRDRFGQHGFLRFDASGPCHLAES